MNVFQFILLLMVAFCVKGQAPANFTYDCRRSGSGCKNSGQCDVASSQCDCTAATGYQGYDCSLATADVKAGDCDNQCENNGVCLTNGGCFCTDNSYGTTCANPRVKVWCTDTDMFINVNPHGAPFSGIIFISKEDGTSGRTEANCVLNNVTGVDLSSFTYVKTAQGETPSLEGYYIVMPHEPAADSTTACQPALLAQNTTSFKVYRQNVILEYNTMIISSLDQVISFDCNISKAAGDLPLTSENAMSVKIFDNDYQSVEVEDKIEPVTFEIRDPDTGKVVTSDVNLGDNLDLIFSLASSGAGGGSSIQEFKVTSCRATNTQPPATGGEPPSIEFLADDCPASGSELLYRDLVTQSTTKNETKIPIKAFRFVGSYDAVAFTCTVKLCTGDILATAPNACLKATCPGESTGNSTDTTGGNTGTGNGTDTSGGDTGTGNSTETAGGNTGTGNSTDTTGGTTGNSTDTTVSTDESATNSTDTPEVPNRRRKRAADENEQEVTRTVNVNSPLEPKPIEKEKETAEEKDCMQESQIVLIVVIFSVVLAVKLLVVIVLVVSLLRSRQKVVDVSDTATVDTQSRYTLPRLSLATTM